MVGLILKDLYNLRHNTKLMLILLLVLGLATIPASGLESYITSATLLCSMTVMTTFTFDSNSKWNRFVVTLPVNAKDIVLSKYLLLMTIILLSLILTTTFSIIVSLFLENFNISLIFFSAIAGIVISILFGSIVIPLLFKFGADRARLILLICVFLPVMIFYLITKLLENTNISFNFDNMYSILPWMIPISILIILFISIASSIKIFKTTKQQS